MAEININGLSGANNVTENFYSAKGVAEPRVVLNSDVNLDGSLTARHGKTLFVTLSGCHSLWAGNLACLCAADGILYRIRNGAKENLGTIAGPKYPLSYLDAEDRVYISNPYWQGILDPVTNAISSWGVTLPAGPMLLSGEGGLPAGTYRVCFTAMSGTELSGNGPISEITLTATGGIQVLNRPSGALVWATDANEPIFYLIGQVAKIAEIPTVEPLPSFMCSPPPFLENLCYAFGRIWGSSGPEVYYSQPFNLGWFKLASNRYSFEDTVTMIAKTTTGLFIGMEHRTRFLAGTIPEQMQQQDAGAGSVKGTLAYCNNMPELGWTLGTPEKDFVDVPVWVTTEGIVVGSPSGKFFNITKNKLKMAIPGRGASLYRIREGMIQFLTSFKAGVTGSGAGFTDPDTVYAFKHGHIDTHSEAIREMGSRTKCSDEATVEVRRGGVLI
jgi:hypothetical protein